MSKITIGDFSIGDDEPCFTIAEAGANHDGNLEQALKLIDAAKESHVNSIKFQTYKASKLATKTAPKYWDDGKNNETQFDVFSKLDGLTKDNWHEIFEYSKEKKIMCFSTPFDNESVDLLYSFDVPAFKIASADITNIPLIEHIASKHLPIFISTGMASNDEILEAIDSIKNQGNHDIVIMHCITSYPTNFRYFAIVYGGAVLLIACQYFTSLNLLCIAIICSLALPSSNFFIFLHSFLRIVLNPFFSLFNLCPNFLNSFADI